MQASNLTTKPSKSSISPRLVREKSIFSVEQLMHVIFVCCGFIAVVAVVIISLYMVISGFPIIAQVGLKGFLFGVVWDPLNNTFGILPLILSSVIATAFATLVGGVLGVTVAVF
ncbi:MAG: phosphate ABC transporter permease subunit PstC, partial [Firmicutes bacterium]|nr:phosphate ABC transporter permease subunit PstC [Bacillota bacterium]